MTPPVKRKFVNVITQHDDNTYTVLEKQELRILRKVYFDFCGDNPSDEGKPPDEQFMALRTMLLAGKVPVADIAVFRPIREAHNGPA